MRSEELLNKFRLVRGEIVDDDVYLFTSRLCGNDVGQECDEFRGGMARSRPPEHFARLGIEGGIQTLDTLTFARSRRSWRASLLSTLFHCPRN